MSVQHRDGATVETIHRLELDLMALRAEFATLKAGRRRHRRTGWLVTVVLVGVLALGPGTLLLATNFTDLNPGSPHNADINAIADAGITRGCTSTTYCPNDAVTREQMASFLARTAGLGGSPPVMNALTAINASQLGGHPAGAYLRANGTISLWSSVLTIRSNSSSVNLDYQPEVITVIGPSGGVPIADLFVPLDAMSNLFGTSLRVERIEVCYVVSGAARIDVTRLSSPTNTTVAFDATVRSSSNYGCYSVPANGSQPITSGFTLTLTVSLDNATSYIRLFAVQLVLAPM